MMSATSTSHNTANSYAFLIKPLRLFEKVTWRDVVLPILTMGTLTLPIGSFEGTLGDAVEVDVRERENSSRGIRCLERAQEKGIGNDMENWRRRRRKAGRYINSRGVGEG